MLSAKNIDPSYKIDVKSIKKYVSDFLSGNYDYPKDLFPEEYPFLSYCIEKDIVNILREIICNPLRELCKQWDDVNGVSDGSNEGLLNKIISILRTVASSENTPSVAQKMDVYLKKRAIIKEIFSTLESMKDIKFFIDKNEDKLLKAFPDFISVEPEGGVVLEEVSLRTQEEGFADSLLPDAEEESINSTGSGLSLVKILNNIDLMEKDINKRHKGESELILNFNKKSIPGRLLLIDGFFPNEIAASYFIEKLAPNDRDYKILTKASNDKKDYRDSILYLTEVVESIKNKKSISEKWQCLSNVMINLASLEKGVKKDKDRKDKILNDSFYDLINARLILLTASAIKYLQSIFKQKKEKIESHILGLKREREKEINYLIGLFHKATAPGVISHFKNKAISKIENFNREIISFCEEGCLSGTDSFPIDSVSLDGNSKALGNLISLGKRFKEFFSYDKMVERYSIENNVESLLSRAQAQIGSPKGPEKETGENQDNGVFVIEENNVDSFLYAPLREANKGRKSKEHYNKFFHFFSSIKFSNRSSIVFGILQSLTQGNYNDARKKTKKLLVPVTGWTSISKSGEKVRGLMEGIIDKLEKEGKKLSIKIKNTELASQLVSACKDHKPKAIEPATGTNILSPSSTQQNPTRVTASHLGLLT